MIYYIYHSRIYYEFYYETLCKYRFCFSLVHTFPIAVDGAVEPYPTVVRTMRPHQNPIPFQLL